jgi:LDH2 family malate/lactate/ureidoglycolate dehydrogenase
MPRTNAARMADVLAWADFRGIASHGISMLPTYDIWRRDGRLDMAAEPRVVRDMPVAALIDGRTGLGYVPACLAVELAVSKAAKNGLAAVSVHNSGHFGACGYYTEMAVRAGFIGLVMTSTAARSVAPTGGAERKLGTDPISFGAPAQGGDYFLLDMATTTVAQGKIRNLYVENQPCPPGWILDAMGHPSTEPKDLFEANGLMTFLGGSRECGSYKGYGLAVMVNILSACLSGSSLITDPLHANRPGQANNIGHFFLVIDPGLFRDRDDFRKDVSTMLDSLRATRPFDLEEPVLVAGDPERIAFAQRSATGIDMPVNMYKQIQTLAKDAGALWLLGKPVGIEGVNGRDKPGHDEEASHHQVS